VTVRLSASPRGVGTVSAAAACSYGRCMTTSPTPATRIARRDTTSTAPPTEGTAARSRLASAAVPALGIAGFLLTGMGLSGVGDAPDPHDPASSMAAHFLAFRDDILAAAAPGYLGAAAVTAFAVAIGRRFARHGERTAGAIVAGAGAAVGLYFVACQVIYTTLAYQVAASSAEATKALFVPTIMAVPALALAASTMLAAVAYGSYRARILPRWLSGVSAVGAAVAAVGVFGYAETGYLYPDVQQQWVGQTVMLWVLVTAVTLLVTGQRRAA